MRVIVKNNLVSREGFKIYKDMENLEGKTLDVQEIHAGNTVFHPDNLEPLTDKQNEKYAKLSKRYTSVLNAGKNTDRELRDAKLVIKSAHGGSNTLRERFKELEKELKCVKKENKSILRSLKTSKALTKKLDNDLSRVSRFFIDEKLRVNNETIS